MNTDGMTPMLPIPDPYDPPRPPGAPSYAPARPNNSGPYQVGFNIFFNKKELLQKLQEIFDPADAEHVYQATEARCAYFVTTDRATILNVVEENLEQVRVLCGDLRFVSPTQLLEIVHESSISGDY